MPKTPPICTGVIPPALTPFTEHGEVDYESIKRLADFWVTRVDALFVCGTYGSGPMCGTETRRKIAEAYTSAVNGKIPIIVHVGAASTRAAVELAVHAQASGASAVAAVPPFYYEHSESGVIDYYRRIRDAVDLPFYLYNNPKSSGNPISARLLARIAEEATLDGVKDSSFEVLTIYDMIGTVKTPGFHFVVGTEALVLPAAVMGVDTCVAGLANGLPEAVRNLVSLCSAGSWKEAAAAQLQVLELRKIMKIFHSIPACHAMLKLRGVDDSHPELPYKVVPDERLPELRALLRAQGVAI